MILFKKLILNIASLKFAIGLMIFIAITSAVGTFIPQGNLPEKYIDLYNENPLLGFLDGKNILFLELDHIYTSKWFLTSLIFLCISLAACSFRRQIPSLKASLKWIDFDNQKKFEKLQLASTYKIKSIKDLISNTETLLKKNGWKSLILHNRISARKGLIGKLGPIIVHIGLILLLIGSAYGNLTSNSKEQFLRPNEKLDLINDSSNQKLSVILNDFLIEREIDGKPKQFSSDLDFKSTSSENHEIKKTSVNHPIRYKGLTIYQADWAISDVVLKIDDIKYQIKLKPIPEIGEQIWGVVIELGNKSKKNYLLTVDNENGPVRIFDIEDFSEKEFYLEDYAKELNQSNIELIKIIPSSGIIIKSDPSIPFIYFSFLLIMIGTAISLIPTQQLWIFIPEDSNEVLIGGLSNRNLAGFRKELLDLTNQIKDY